MRVTRYNTRLSEDRLPVLIAEKSAVYNGREKVCLDQPYKVADFLRTVEAMGDLDQENMFLLACDTKLRLIGYFLIGRGTVNSCVVSMRDIFVKALSVGAVSIILAHNHPSGDPTPSKEDVDITRRVNSAGKLLGIELLDHLIIAEGTYCSLRERGVLDDN